jgi:CubicO group peptidase (beta-lactamase class C family)
METVHYGAVLLIASLSLLTSAPAHGKDALPADETAQIAEVFAQYDQPASPGCAVGVIRAGQLVQARGFGMANLEHGIPNGPSLVYDIGSTAKQFTAASILLLAQRGKLSLDDDVRKYVPELPEYQRPIKVRHLLHHTSGLRDYLGLFSLAGMNFEDTTTEQDALDFILRQKALNFAPGDEFFYSNSGYLLLSIIVRRTSGKPLSEFAKENIFDPLGMRDTLILDRHRKIVPRRATAYSRNAVGEFQIQMSNFEQTGDGALLTSIEDLAKWDRNFYEPKVGDRQWLDQMHIAGRLSDGVEIDYAAGLYVDRHSGLRRVSHQGAWAGYRADLIRFPERRLSVACLCNAGGLDVTGLAMKVAAIYLKNVANEKASVQDAWTKAATTTAVLDQKAQALVGLYRSATTGELRRIDFVDGKVMIDPLAAQRREIRHIGPNRFVSETPGTVIEFESKNGNRQLKLTRENRPALSFERVEKFEPDAHALQEFSGTYFSPELEAIYELHVEEGNLVLATPNATKRALVATYRDAFAVLSGPQLEFDRDSSGRIAGFNLTSGRVRNLKFEMKRTSGHASNDP